MKVIVKKISRDIISVNEIRIPFLVQIFKYIRFEIYLKLSSFRDELLGNHRLFETTFPISDKKFKTFKK